jgi:hypothetical protein
VTLRQALGADAGRLHRLLDELLDGEDVVLVLFDGRRAVNYIHGFDSSPCQLELMAVEIERTVRRAAVSGPYGAKGRRVRDERGSDSDSDSGSGRRVRQRLGGAGGRPDGGVVDRRNTGSRSGAAPHGNCGLAARPVLRLASAVDASSPG